MGDQNVLILQVSSSDKGKGNSKTVIPSCHGNKSVRSKNRYLLEKSVRFLFRSLKNLPFEYPKPQRRRLVSFVLLNFSLTTCVKFYTSRLQFTHRVYNLHIAFTIYTSCLIFAHRVFNLHKVFVFCTSCLHFYTLLRIVFFELHLFYTISS